MYVLVFHTRRYRYVKIRRCSSRLLFCAVRSVFCIMPDCRAKLFATEQ